ncbi:hypothetical protein Taro_045485 [Colocasia esculenta]|uniref:Uncharacterized protein n=1 Tax=Colocasia esculenta TaxID=4460 RepID=A0A843X4A6_COLES|nr:hypothetical protein [Colocasia esculenta]
MADQHERFSAVKIKLCGNKAVDLEDLEKHVTRRAQPFYAKPRITSPVHRGPASVPTSSHEDPHACLPAALRCSRGHPASLNRPPPDASAPSREDSMVVA